jgi:hypothetical protein
MKYMLSFVFFIPLEDTKIKDEVLDALDELGIDYDVYSDDEDWNIECLYEVEYDDEPSDEVFHKMLLATLPDACWDWHYIKGLNNDYYWQP